MKNADFIRELCNMMEIESTLDEDSCLLDIPEFDSLTIMSLVAYTDKNFHKKINFDALSTVVTVRELMDAIGRENFER